MTYIEPLNLETWIVNIFSGNLNIFTSIAVISIMGLAAYFRMTGLGVGVMFVLFFMMFSGYVSQEIYFIILAVLGLVIGYWLSRIVKN